MGIKPPEGEERHGLPSTHHSLSEKSPLGIRLGDLYTLSISHLIAG